MLELHGGSRAKHSRRRRSEARPEPEFLAHQAALDCAPLPRSAARSNHHPRLTVILSKPSPGVQGRYHSVPTGFEWRTRIGLVPLGRLRGLPRGGVSRLLRTALRSTTAALSPGIAWAMSSPSARWAIWAATRSPLSSARPSARTKACATSARRSGSGSALAHRLAHTTGVRGVTSEVEGGSTGLTPLRPRLISLRIRGFSRVQVPSAPLDFRGFCHEARGKNGGRPAGGTCRSGRRSGREPTSWWPG